MTKGGSPEASYHRDTISTIVKTRGRRRWATYIQVTDARLEGDDRCYRHDGEVVSMAGMRKEEEVDEGHGHRSLKMEQSRALRIR